MSRSGEPLTREDIAAKDGGIFGVGVGIGVGF
jgi:hypothetical protein